MALQITAPFYCARTPRVKTVFQGLSARLQGGRPKSGARNPFTRRSAALPFATRRGDAKFVVRHSSRQPLRGGGQSLAGHAQPPQAGSASRQATPPCTLVGLSIGKSTATAFCLGKLSIAWRVGDAYLDTPQRRLRPALPRICSKENGSLTPTRQRPAPLSPAVPPRRRVSGPGRNPPACPAWAGRGATPDRRLYILVCLRPSDP